MNTFGEFMKSRRKQLYLTIKKLSQETSITEANLSYYENHKACPSMKALQAIAKVLKFSLGDVNFLSFYEGKRRGRQKKS